VLPRSGVALQLNPKPVLTEADIAGADIAEVELGRCLLLHLTPAAGRDFYRLTVAHQGRRLALQLDGVVIGARRIDGPVADGRVFLFVELPDEALPGLVEELRATAAVMRRKTGEKR
jgi:preprotein translocase subunit SecD